MSESFVKGFLVGVIYCFILLYIALEVDKSGYIPVELIPCSAPGFESDMCVKGVVE